MKKQEKETTKKKNVKKVTKKEEKKVVEQEVEIKDKKEKKEKPKKEKKQRVGFFKSIFNFFKGVKDEMSKVVWPTRRNMIKYSIATIIFIIAFALYFYGIEVLMAWLKDNIVV